MSALSPASPPLPPGLPARAAASVLGISETTLRRALKHARDLVPGEPAVQGTCAGVRFIAWRDPSLPRGPWRFTFPADHRASVLALIRLPRRSPEERLRTLRQSVESPTEGEPSSGAEHGPQPGRLRRWAGRLARPDRLIPGRQS